MTRMTQRELSNQSELVYQLDSEPVFDYLLQHRALTQSTVDVIKGKRKEVSKLRNCKRGCPILDQLAHIYGQIVRLT